MPWKACDLMSLRIELTTLGRQPDVDQSALARRYGISRKTLYNCLARSRDDVDGRNSKGLCRWGAARCLNVTRDD